MEILKFFISFAVWIFVARIFLWVGKKIFND